jgi:ABC-type sugar transport system permease subunit/ABC-type glycerol-3-phosphate transport system substrate-binding protein
MSPTRGLALSLLAALFLPTLAPADRPTELVIWGVWNREGWRKCFDEFELRHPDIKLVTSATGGRMDEQKLMCGIAGGAPPDCINQDRFSIGGWAARGAFLQLDEYIERDRNEPDGVRPGDFYKACWDEVMYQGHVYAIPINTDDRALYYNEDLLRQAGYVDAQGNVVPPRTWEELKAYALKLTERDANGKITRIGFIPNYGNSWLYLYAWQNGGEFMSPDGKRCTLDAPANVQALQYVTDVYDALGGAEEVNGFAASFQTGELDPFLIGKVAMVINGNWHLEAIARYKPDLHFGVVPAPVPPGHTPITWSGGFSWAIPRGAKHVEAAWEFVKFMNSMEAGRTDSAAEYAYARSWGRTYVPWMYANRRVNEMAFREFAPKQGRIRQYLRLFMSLMPESRFRPVTPVGQLLWDEHVRAMDAATHHEKTPQEALADGAKAVQTQLDLLMNESPGRPVSWPLIGLGALLAVGLIVGLAWPYLRRRFSTSVGGRREAVAGFLFASPWFTGFLVFTGGPVVVSLVLSFCRYDVLHPPVLTGVENYRTLFLYDPLFWKSLGNTWFMVLGVPIGMAIGLGVAMLLNSAVRGLTIYRTIYYMPAIVPTVASSILWMWVLNPQHGLINRGLAALSIGGPNWLTSAAWAKPSIILMGLWGAGQGMIIWLAGLKGIPQTYYEAAEIDGASAFRRFTAITLPMLTPYVFFSTIMGIIGTFQIFNQAYIMTQGGPVDSTLFYVYFLFNNGFRYFKMGYASALAWVLFWIILALTLIQLKLAPRWVHYDQ